MINNCGTKKRFGLDSFFRHLIEKSFGRIRENYLRSLGNCLVETKEYRKFITYLTLIDLDKFENILTDIKEYARNQFKIKNNSKYQ